MEQDKLQRLLEGDQDDPQVAFELGLCYLHGEGTEQDPVEAQKWLQSATELGHEEAIQMPEDAKPKETPLDLSVTEHNLPDLCYAAEMGNVDSQYALAQYFFRTSYSEGIRYLETAVKLGHPQACFQLGKLLNNKETKALMQNAADCGHKEAMLFLANMAVKAHNPQEAESWFLKVAECGDAMDKLNMALVYVFGQKVCPSTGKSMAWVNQAKQAGMEDALERFHKEQRAFAKTLTDAHAHIAEINGQREAEAAKAKEIQERSEAAEQRSSQKTEKQLSILRFFGRPPIICLIFAILSFWVKDWLPENVTVVFCLFLIVAIWFNNRCLRAANHTDSISGALLSMAFKLVFMQSSILGLLVFVGNFGNMRDPSSATTVITGIFYTILVLLTLAEYIYYLVVQFGLKQQVGLNLFYPLEYLFAYIERKSFPHSQEPDDTDGVFEVKSIDLDLPQWDYTPYDLHMCLVGDSRYWTWKADKIGELLCATANYKGNYCTPHRNDAGRIDAIRVHDVPEEEAWLMNIEMLEGNQMWYNRCQN